MGISAGVRGVSVPGYEGVSVPGYEGYKGVALGNKGRLTILYLNYRH